MGFRFIKGFRSRTRPVPGEMNKTEARYADVLELERLAGEIIDFRFQPTKWRLADRTFYEPDFLVITADWTAQYHEVKAQWSTGKAGIEEDAGVKIKLAAELYPWFQFVLAMERAKKNGGGFIRTSYGKGFDRG